MEQIKNYFPQFWGKKSQIKPLCNMLNVAKKYIRTRLRKPWLLMLFFNSVAWNIYTLLSIELNYLTMEKRNTYIILMTLGVIFPLVMQFLLKCSFCDTATAGNYHEQKTLSFYKEQSLCITWSKLVFCDIWVN